MMAVSIKQRSDYTFKHNIKLGRHGWLRLTPAYSVKLVDELLAGDMRSRVIHDPFSGTGTTGLVSSQRNKASYSYEINPFLIWFARAKCERYTAEHVSEAHTIANAMIAHLHDGLTVESNPLPPIYNIERWWHRATLPLLGCLRAQLCKKVGEPSNNHVGNLLWVAFCRLVIETSSAAFNHVSMSFHDGVTTFEINEISDLFLDILDAICASATDNPNGKAEILCVDSTLESANCPRFDRVITSPPYPNRISYIRELRPYMYWTGFLDTARSAGELDWKAIGGTWGIATSRLNDWKPTETHIPSSIMETALAIQQSEQKNSFLMAQYVLKYFHDMFLHLKNLRSQLSPNAQLNYIVGNSTYFGVPVHSERLYEDIFSKLGYKDIGSRIIRKRNSKKELYEFDIYATAAG